jgi:lipopolysaccharide transport system ATP-binding protein
MIEPAVQFLNVSKRFRLTEPTDSLRELIGGALARLAGRRRRADSSVFWALRNVDFSLQAGESLGVIGPNGAGKSTVLKLLAGILKPDAGHVHVCGRVTALIEVGAGFHGDLTGRENIFLHGAILGMSRRETREKLDAIVDFAGIGRFLDVPVKRYSSGMYARLGFSIAAHVDPDILLVDEVLSVGDAVFRLRCLERMRSLIRGGTSLVFVTHNLDQLQTVCPRAFVLEEGRCSFDGPSQEAVCRYLSAMSRASAVRATDVPNAGRENAEDVRDVHLEVFNGYGEATAWIQCDEPVQLRLRFDLRRAVRELILELNLRVTDRENLLSFNSGREGRVFRADAGPQAFVLDLPRIPLCGGQYFWNVRLWDAERGVTLADTPLCFPMVVHDGGRACGKLVLDHAWSHDRPAKADSGATPWKSASLQTHATSTSGG